MKKDIIVTKPIICRIYERVSSEAQKSSGLGLAAQRDACKRYATQQGYKVAKYYRDAGISGAKGVDNRPQLALLLQELKPNEVILVSKRDRLSRSTMLNLWLEDHCKKIKVVIESAAGEGNGSDPANEMMRRIIDAFSEYERNLISARTKAALKKAKDRGKILGRCDFGFKRDTIGRVIKDTKTFPIRERIIQCWKDGMGWTDIANALNVDGVPTQKGSEWFPTTVMRICNKEAAEKMKKQMNDEKKDVESELNDWEKD